MRAGDVRRVRVTGRRLWCCRLVSKSSKQRAWLVEWLTGPLAGREANVLTEYMVK